MKIYEDENGGELNVYYGLLEVSQGGYEVAAIRLPTKTKDRSQLLDKLTAAILKYGDEA